MTAQPLLSVIEEYYDAVPRTAARAEDLSPFTLFITEGGGWPYYARPALGATTFTAADLARVRARQRELAVPESFEWVAETTPELRDAAETAGLVVVEYPLMVLEGETPVIQAVPAEIDVRLVTVGDDLDLLRTVAAVGFAAPGTSPGPEGTGHLARATTESTPKLAAFKRARLEAGWTVSAVALTDEGPVGVGSHQPLGMVSEVVGVATLPAYRRRGIGASITGLLVLDARRRGVRTVFLSAAGDAVARIYARLGFRRIATACIAEPTGTPDYSESPPRASEADHRHAT